MRFLRSATTAGILLLLLAAPVLAGPGRIFADDRTCQGCPAINFDLWLGARVIEPIPPVAVGEPASRPEQAAMMIDAGNQVLKTVRDSQDRYDWYLGSLEPHGSRTDTFTWLSDQRLVFVLDDGRKIRADRLIVSSGPALILGPVIRMDRGLTAQFADITIRFPTGEFCVLYAAFPKGTWDFSNVEELLIVRGTQAEEAPQ